MTDQKEEDIRELPDIEDAYITGFMVAWQMRKDLAPSCDEGVEAEELAEKNFHLWLSPFFPSRLVAFIPTIDMVVEYRKNYPAPDPDPIDYERFSFLATTAMQFVARSFRSHGELDDDEVIKNLTHYVGDVEAEVYLDLIKSRLTDAQVEEFKNRPKPKPIYKATEATWNDQLAAAMTKKMEEAQRERAERERLVNDLRSEDGFTREKAARELCLHKSGEAISNLQWVVEEDRDQIVRETAQESLAIILADVRPDMVTFQLVNSGEKVLAIAKEFTQRNATMEGDWVFFDPPPSEDIINSKTNYTIRQLSWFDGAIVDTYDRNVRFLSFHGSQNQDDMYHCEMKLVPSEIEEAIAGLHKLITYKLPVDHEADRELEEYLSQKIPRGEKRKLVKEDVMTEEDLLDLMREQVDKNGLESRTYIPHMEDDNDV